jgi:hypothetical protein
MIETHHRSIFFCGMFASLMSLVSGFDDNLTFVNFLLCKEEKGESLSRLQFGPAVLFSFDFFPLFFLSLFNFLLTSDTYLVKYIFVMVTFGV